MPYDLGNQLIEESKFFIPPNTKLIYSNAGVNATFKLLIENQLFTINEKYVKYNHYDDLPSMTYFKISEPIRYKTSPEIVLGRPLFNHFCVFYDYENLEVGIGQEKN